MSDSPVFDLAVVGAGFVGAATAYAFQQRRPGASVAVLEKEAAPAVHQTSHNSGVIHAGVYYKPGSLKAQLCIDGYRKMLDFCEENDVFYRISGKLIVAVNHDEMPRLQMLKERAEANGVPGARLLDVAGLREIEPNAGGIAALHVPSTAITDYEKVTQRLIDTVGHNGGMISYNFPVTDIDQAIDATTLRTSDGRMVTARSVVVCAGARSDQVQRMIRPDDDFAILPFRGAYYELTSDAADRVKSMIYPVPDLRFPFLGVHFTRHVDESVSCGPNAVLSPTREDYRRFAIKLGELGTSLRFPGTWKVAKKYWRECVAELTRDLSKKRFTEAARKYLPDIEASDMHEYHFGIRAQAISRSGALIDDFDFKRFGNLLLVRNAPSPAATASLAIAEHILDELAS